MRFLMILVCLALFAGTVDAQGARGFRGNGSFHGHSFFNYYAYQQPLVIQQAPLIYQAPVVVQQAPVVVQQAPVVVQQAPVYQAPVYQAPVYQAPVVVQPSYAQSCGTVGLGLSSYGLGAVYQNFNTQRFQNFNRAVHRR